DLAVAARRDRAVRVAAGALAAVVTRFAVVDDAVAAALELAARAAAVAVGRAPVVAVLAGVLDAVAAHLERALCRAPGTTVALLDAAAREAVAARREVAVDQARAGVAVRPTEVGLLARLDDAVSA